ATGSSHPYSIIQTFIVKRIVVLPYLETLSIDRCDGPSCRFSHRPLRLEPNFSSCSSDLTKRSAHCFDKRFEWEDPKSEDEIVTVNFILKDGKQVTVNGKIGDNVMYLAQRHGIDIEGACEASLACTTCHVYVDDNYLEKLTPAEEK
ncbi:adrenodoxin-like protein, mitochondrial, partial [Centruroides sculpturatus]|uniref:adrenodoxin-like protein, mitochondrial n=1 Tax=Centruroides sculpturatus TaxID=218467 RepID=UPI000C6EE1B1